MSFPHSPHIKAILENPDLIKEIAHPSVEECIAAADGQLIRCSNGYYAAEIPVDPFEDIIVTEEMAIAVVSRGDCLTCFLPADCWTPAVATAAVAADPQTILDIPQSLLTPDICRDVLERGFPWRLTGSILIHIWDIVRREDLLAAMGRVPHIIDYIAEPDDAMVIAAAQCHPQYICYSKNGFYTTWLSVGRPQKNIRFLHMFGKIYRRAKPAPPSITGPLEDPLTLDTIPAGTTCGFLRSKNGDAWYLAGTADTLAAMIHNQFQGSSFDRIFVPHRNKCVDFREIRWFTL